MAANFDYTLHSYIKFEVITVGRDKNGKAFYAGGIQATPNDVGDFQEQVSKHQQSVKEFIARTPGLDKCWFTENIIADIIDDTVPCPLTPPVAE
jgi:hypothetical protein